MREISIAAKIKYIAALTALLFAALTASIQFLAYRNAQFLIDVKRDYDVIDQSVVPLVAVSKGLELDVAEVQQFLSDISATRGQDGLDDGYKDAEDSAKSFRKEIVEARALAKQLDNLGLVAGLDLVAGKFESFYADGKVMAEAYIKEGPAGGIQDAGLRRAGRGHGGGDDESDGPDPSGVGAGPGADSGIDRAARRGDRPRTNHHLRFRRPRVGVRDRDRDDPAPVGVAAADRDDQGHEGAGRRPPRRRASRPRPHGRDGPHGGGRAGVPRQRGGAQIRRGAGRGAAPTRRGGAGGA